MQEKKATGLRRQHQLAKISIQTVFTISVLLRYLAALSLAHFSTTTTIIIDPMDFNLFCITHTFYLFCFALFQFLLTFRFVFSLIWSPHSFTTKLTKSIHSIDSFSCSFAARIGHTQTHTYAIYMHSTCTHTDDVSLIIEFRPTQSRLHASANFITFDIQL